jgi:hypothetical protein
MKTSLNDLRLTEDYLLSNKEDGSHCLFAAKMILQPELGEEVYWQKKTYQVVQDYGRKQLKMELEKIHDTLFNTRKHQTFRQRIMRMFNQ